MSTNKLTTLGHLKAGLQQAKSYMDAQDAVLSGRIDAVVADIEGIVSVGGEPNILEGVKVNGQALAITDKMVDILIAAGDENGTIKVNGAAVAITGLAGLAYKSEITEDELGAALKASIAAKATNADLELLTVRVGNIEAAGYQNAQQVQEAIQAAIAASGHAHFEEVDAVPSAEDAKENVMYLVMNETTGHYDIYAKVGESVVLLDDTTVDLSAYAKTAEVTAAISAAITGLNIEQYATDTELNAAIERIAAVEAKFADYYTKAEVDALFANYYTKAEVDAELAKKMNVADMGAYATDEEAAAEADAAEAAAKAHADEKAAAAESAAKAHAEEKATAAETAAKGYAEEKAGAAEQAAKDYADGLAGNYDAAGSAADAEEAAKAYTDEQLAAKTASDEEVNSMLGEVFGE